MNLGKILEGLAQGPSVSHPVKFRVGGLNGQAQKARVLAEAVLVYVSEEERADALVEAAKYLAKKFAGAPIPPQVQESEETIRFMAIALRDKADPAKVFCETGPDQLRAALPLDVLYDLSAEYRKFIAAEYKVELTDEDEKKLKEQAAGK
jgi:hypothetical protein